MDSARFPRMPRQRLFDREPPTAVEEGDAEGGFEDVGLNDDDSTLPEAIQEHQQAAPQPKKKSFFSKFTDHANQEGASGGGTSPVVSPSPTSSRFSLLPGRKRGQSGQGAELGVVERPRTAVRDAGGRELTDISA